jgi:hypothetical protein
MIQDHIASVSPIRNQVDRVIELSELGKARTFESNVSISGEQGRSESAFQIHFYSRTERKSQGDRARIIEWCLQYCTSQVLLSKVMTPSEECATEHISKTQKIIDHALGYLKVLE